MNATCLTCAYVTSKNKHCIRTTEPPLPDDREKVVTDKEIWVREEGVFRGVIAGDDRRKVGKNTFPGPKNFRH